MAGMEEIDIELLIDEVKKYPEIWNVSAETTKKRGAWVSVCRSFDDEFDQKDDNERSEICNKMIKKWRNIKDNFMKSLKRKTKSGQAAASGKRYIYARQLSFLQAASATTETQSSLGDEDGEDEANLVFSGEQYERNPAQSEESRKPLYEQNSSRKRKRDIEAALIDFMKTPIPSPVVTESNQDRSFFESILPSMSDFTEDQKLEFRCEILNIIKRMRMPTPPQHYYHHLLHPVPNAPSPTYPTPYSSQYFLNTQSPQAFAHSTAASHNSSRNKPHEGLSTPKPHHSNFMSETEAIKKSTHFKNLESPRSSFQLIPSSEYFHGAATSNASNDSPQDQSHKHLKPKSHSAGLNPKILFQANSSKPISPLASSSSSGDSQIYREDDNVGIFRKEFC